MGAIRKNANLCMPAKIPGIAGPANFQQRLAAGMIERGWSVSYGFDGGGCDVVLVIGGTREFRQLRHARRKGIPIVQRLNGMNWIHRVARTGVRHFLRAELNNIILRVIRHRFANWIVYQSNFAQRWWEDKYGASKLGQDVIHNGVPLDQYSPKDEDDRTSDRLRLLMVEGNLSGGYEFGLETGVQFAGRLNERTEPEVKLVVVGSVPEPLQRTLTRNHSSMIEWVGLQSSERIPSYYRSADLFFAGDPNPACPNAVIEAMACGLPVVAFDSGAIPEIVVGVSGRHVPYGGDVWKLEQPDINGLVDAAIDVLQRSPAFREGARNRAVDAFDVETMVDRYVSVFENVLGAGLGQ